MKVKELLKKYKDYTIEMQGKPLKEMVIPYTFLPKDKKLEECEVVDMEVVENEHKVVGVSFKDLKTTKTEYKKGYVRAYIK